MRRFASLISLSAWLMACGEPSGDFGFRIESVDIASGYRSLVARIAQTLRISPEARVALDHGVPLTVEVQLELREASTLTLLYDESRRYEIHYQPMLDDYQLVSLAGDPPQVFPRLRHVLNALGSLRLELNTGSLAPGSYELRTRTRIDQARLPAPMRLPARFSAQWQHDSGWTTWPLEIGA